MWCSNRGWQASKRNARRAGVWRVGSVSCGSRWGPGRPAWRRRQGPPCTRRTALVPTPPAGVLQGAIPLRTAEPRAAPHMTLFHLFQQRAGITGELGSRIRIKNQESGVKNKRTGNQNVGIGIFGHLGLGITLYKLGIKKIRELCIKVSNIKLPYATA